ncbi:MAG TPA: hypothetical protein ENO30_06570 [Thermodesulfobium narugense]|nr:hypothetical protein [Thermodesulfobium narugense]
MKKLFFTIILFAAASFASVCSDMQFYSPSQGYVNENYCHQENENKVNSPPIAEETPKKQDTSKYHFPKVAKVPWDELDNMSPEQIQKLLQQVRDIAIMHPTFHNVIAYKRLLSYINKKSTKFMHVFDQVQRMDIEFANEFGKTGGYPLPGYAQASILAEKRHEQAAFLQKYHDYVGLLVFYEPGCAYCAKFIPVVKEYFEPRTGLDVRYVNIMEHPNLAKALGVRVTPSAFVVIRTANGPYVIPAVVGYANGETLLKSVYEDVKFYFKQTSENTAYY